MENIDVNCNYDYTEVCRNHDLFLTKVVNDYIRTPRKKIIINPITCDEVSYLFLQIFYQYADFCGKRVYIVENNIFNRYRIKKACAKTFNNKPIFISSRKLKKIETEDNNLMYIDLDLVYLYEHFNFLNQNLFDFKKECEDIYYDYYYQW